MSCLLFLPFFLEETSLTRTRRPPVVFIDTKKKARQYLDEAASHPLVAVDSEFDLPGSQYEGEVALFSYSWGAGIRRVVTGEMLKTVYADWMVDRKIKKVWFNYKADEQVIGKFAKLDTEPSFKADVMVMDWCADELDVLHNLKHSSGKWLGWKRQGYKDLFSYVPPGKKLKKVMSPGLIMRSECPPDAYLERTPAQWIEDLIVYAGDDAESTMLLYRYLRKVLQDRGYWKTYLKDDAPFTLTLLHCQRRGINLDVEGLKVKQQIVWREMMRLRRVFRTECGVPDINIQSGPQLKKLLFEDLEWPQREDFQTDGGQPSLNKEAKAWYRDELGYFLADILSQYDGKKVLNGTFLKGLILGVDPDGRMRSDLNQLGAKSGRISSRKFDRIVEVRSVNRKGEEKVSHQKKKVGANLQNIPTKRTDEYGIRGDFIATPGYGLVVADLAGADLVMAMHEASKYGPCPMLDAYIGGGDIHGIAAKVLCNLPCDASEVKKLYKYERDEFGKKCNFNLLYGGSPKMLCRILGWDWRIPKVLRKAERWCKKWLRLWSGLARYQKEIVKFGYNHGYVETLSGRRVHVYKYLDSDDPGVRGYGERLCMNGPCQGGVADIMKAAMNAIDKDKELARWGYVQLFPVHDEVVGEAPKKRTKRSLKRVIHHMTNTEYQALVPYLKAEGGVGPTWTTAK